MKLQLNPTSLIQSFQQSDLFSPPKIRNKLGDLFFAMIANLPGSFSLKQSHSLTHRSENSIPVQTTTLKISRAVQLTWSGNVGSPRELNICLDNFERNESLRKKSGFRSISAIIEEFERSESLRNKSGMDIPNARSLIAYVADVYEAIQTFKDDLLEIKKTLQQQSTNFDEEILLIDRLVTETTKIVLPNELTQASIRAYEERAIQFCTKELTQIKNARD